MQLYEQVNNFFKHFLHKKRRANRFWTALFCDLMEGWETGKEPVISLNKESTHYKMNK